MLFSPWSYQVIDHGSHQVSTIREPFKVRYIHSDHSLLRPNSEIKSQIFIMPEGSVWEGSKELHLYNNALQTILKCDYKLTNNSGTDKLYNKMIITEPASTHECNVMKLPPALTIGSFQLWWVTTRGETGETMSDPPHNWSMFQSPAHVITSYCYHGNILFLSSSPVLRGWEREGEGGWVN